MSKREEKNRLEQKKMMLEKLNDSDTFLVIVDGSLMLNASDEELVKMLSGLADGLRANGKSQEHIKTMFDIASDDEKESYERFKNNMKRLMDLFEEEFGDDNE